MSEDNKNQGTPVDEIAHDVKKLEEKAKELVRGSISPCHTCVLSTI